MAGYLRWAAWAGVMALAMFVFCERVRLAMGDVSIVLCTLGGARFMEGNLDRVRCAIGSSRLVVGICVIGMYGGFGITILGCDAGGRSSWGHRIGRRIELGRARVCKGVARGGFACGVLLLVVQSWIA